MSRKLTLEHGFYTVAFVLALAIRMIGLGKLPLSDVEANWALQALNVAGGSHTVGAHPLYILSTALVFFLLGAGDFLARFWPSIIGSLIVFAPWLFRKNLGSFAAVLAALFLAVDPILLPVSRQASGDVFTFVFMVFALGFLNTKHYSLTGASFALAMLGGPLVWSGILVLLIVLCWSVVLFRKKPDPLALSWNDIKPGSSDLTRMAGWFLGTLLAIGTALFQVPQGLSGLGQSLALSVPGWSGVGDLSALRVLAILLTYSPLLVVLGISGTVLSLLKPNAWDGLLVRWWLIALVLALLYPAHQVADLAWSVVPLSFLSARIFARWIEARGSTWKLSLGQAIAVCLVLFSILLNLIWFSNPYQAGDVNAQIRFVAIAGGVLIILLISVLFAATWTIRTGLNGLGWGLILFVSFYTISAAWHSAGLGRNPNVELWRSSYCVADSRILLQSMQDMSEWSTGIHSNLDVIVSGVSSPSLHWLLRDWKQAEFSAPLEMDAAPSLVLTPVKESLNLPSAYTGQDFILSEKPNWYIATAQERIRWFFYREIPIERQTITLWVRSDLFPGADVFPNALPEVQN